MSYNMSFLDTSNTLLDVYTGINIATSGIISMIFLILLYIILIASFRAYDSDRVFIISGFITSVVAGLMFFLGLIVWWIVMLFVMLFLISIIIYFFNN